MKNESVFLYAESGRADVWEQEEKSSYDAKVLDAQYQERLFSENGLALLDSLDGDVGLSVLRAGGR